MSAIINEREGERTKEIKNVVECSVIEEAFDLPRPCHYVEMKTVWCSRTEILLIDWKSGTGD